MRIVNTDIIKEEIKKLFIEANMELPCELEKKINQSQLTETNQTAKKVLKSLAENMDAAREMNVPICQDTGMAVVFVELGKEVFLEGKLLKDAINEGVAAAYTEGYLRCSIVSDPLRRVNTGNNTPAIIHLEIVEGDKIKLIAAPKGFGSENMSALKMLTPAAGRQGVVEFILESVKKAGSNPCPPMVIGIGIGGNFEEVTLLAKKALTRSVEKRNADPFYAELEEELLRQINQTGIGPQGFGGDTTALAVNVEVGPTHIAGLPVALNMGCHVTRHASCII